MLIVLINLIQSYAIIYFYFIKGSGIVSQSGWAISYKPGRALRYYLLPQQLCNPARSGGVPNAKQYHQRRRLPQADAKVLW